MRGLLQLVDGLLDGVGVIVLGRLLDFVHGRLNGCLIAFGNLVRVLLEQFFHLPDHLVGVVAGVDQLVLASILLSVGFGIALHAIDLGLAQAAGAFNANLLLLARGQILGGDVQDAVGVDVERDFDLRHAARRRRNAVQVELA